VCGFGGNLKAAVSNITIQLQFVHYEQRGRKRNYTIRRPFDDSY